MSLEFMKVDGLTVYYAINMLRSNIIKLTTCFPEELLSY